MFFRFALYGFLKNLRFFDPFIILILLDNGLSFLQIGFLYSVREATSNVLEIPSGLYADTFGRRRALILAFVFYISSFGLFHLSSGFPLYCVSMIFFGLGEAFRSGTHKSIILAYLNQNQMHDQKVAYYGRTRAASQLGSAANSLIAAALVFYTNSYQYLFIAATFPYILGLVNVMTYPKELDAQLRCSNDRSAWKEISRTFGSLLSIIKDRFTLQALTNSASFTACFKATKDYLQTIVQMMVVSIPLFVDSDETRRTAILVGIAYFLIHLLSSYASQHADQFSRRFRSLPAAINTTFILGAFAIIASGLATWTNLSFLAVLNFLALFVLQNLRKPVNVAFISEQLPSRVMASGLSLESQLTSILVVIFAPVLGALADRFGIGPALTAFGVLVLLLALVTQVRDRAAASNDVT